MTHNEMSIIDVLYNLSADPAIKERKMQLYKAKELKLLGVKSIEEIEDPAIRESLEDLIEDNTIRASQQPRSKMNAELMAANGQCFPQAIESETTRIDIDNNPSEDFGKREEKKVTNVN